MLQKITTRPKLSYPFANCHFSSTRFDLCINGASDTTTIGVTSAIAGRTIRITIFFILSNCGLFFMRNDAETNLMEI